MDRTKEKNTGKKGITLRDVMIHVGHVGQQLSTEIKGVKADVTGLKIEVQSIKVGMKNMEQRLTQRIDALDEDLTATMKDTLRIRQHVGMPVVLE